MGHHHQQQQMPKECRMQMAAVTRQQQQQLLVLLQMGMLLQGQAGVSSSMAPLQGAAEGEGGSTQGQHPLRPAGGVAGAGSTQQPLPLLRPKLKKLSRQLQQLLRKP
jgi:hypothetical protein